MRAILSLIALVLVVGCSTSGCSTKYSDFFPRRDDGSVKPSLVLLPIESEVVVPLSGDWAREMTEGLRQQLMEEGSLFMPPETAVQRILERSPMDWYHTKDLNAFRAFAPSQFVACLEVVDYHEQPYKRGECTPLYPASIDPDRASVVCIKVRLKIVDIRGSTPKIVRRELVQSNHVVEKNAIRNHLAMEQEGSISGSALLMVHARLLQDLAQKIETTCLRSR